MKYSEAILRLEKDPTLEFKLVEGYKTWTLKTSRRGEPYHFILDCEGEDSYGDAGHFSGNLLINDDRWVEVKRTVTWQEALQAWAEWRTKHEIVGSN